MAMSCETAATILSPQILRFVTTEIVLFSERRRPEKGTGRNSGYRCDSIVQDVLEIRRRYIHFLAVIQLCSLCSQFGGLNGLERKRLACVGSIAPANCFERTAGRHRKRRLQAGRLRSSQRPAFLPATAGGADLKTVSAGGTTKRRNFQIMAVG